MGTSNYEKFDEIIKTTRPDELEAMCELITAGRLVKNMDGAGSIMSVEALRSVYSDPVHIAAMKSLYRESFVVASNPIVDKAFGDKTIYTVSNKGLEFLKYFQK